MRSGLHSILTSSQSYPRRRWNRDAGIHGVFKRPQVRQCRDVFPACARERPPGHRRLRFSFQFNDVKDPDRQAALPFSVRPAVGGGGYLWRPPSPVNRSSRGFVSPPRGTPKSATKPAQVTPRGFPHVRLGESIERRKMSSWLAKVKWLRAARHILRPER